jgi:hypothetical protein
MPAAGFTVAAAKNSVAPENLLASLSDKAKDGRGGAAAPTSPAGHVLA